MLTEERYQKILNVLAQRGTVTVSDLSEELNSSESTIRRDLLALDGMKKLNKVHGGATSIAGSYSFEEHTVETKEKLFVEEKEAIAKYAAGTVRRDDFIYIDAGTTTEKMIDYLTERSITVVTNGFTHAKKLAARGFKAYLAGGQIKASTEAIVGAEGVELLSRFNFNKCYLGTNGISLTAGFTTPDIDEANIKRAAAQNSYVTYILADHSKFDKVSSVTFTQLSKACIITDRLSNDKYSNCIIKEVLK